MRHLPGNRDVVGGQYLTFVSPKKKKKKVVGQYYNNYSYIYIYISEPSRMNSPYTCNLPPFAIRAKLVDYSCKSHLCFQSKFGGLTSHIFSISISLISVN